MARISAKVEPIETNVELLFPEVFGSKAKSLALAATARQELGNAQRTNARVFGRPTPYTQFVDGKQGAPLDSVRPNGTIVFEFELLDEVFRWIGEQLIRHSPVGDSSDRRPGHPGMYRRSHVFTADGIAIDPGVPVPLDATEFAFINVQPYARKIERGLSPQAPDGVYAVVAKLANSRFSKAAKIRFSYRSPTFGAIQQWATTTPMSTPYRRGSARQEWLTRQPAIVVTPH